MRYFAGKIRRLYCAVFLIAFYISLQAFVTLYDASAFSSNLLDARSVSMALAIKRINGDAAITPRAASAFSLAASGFAVQPRPLSCAFSEGLGAFFLRLSAWVFWNEEIGAPQEARPSAAMVFRE